MGDVVNLRRLRKDKQRKAADAKAEANRLAFGRSKVERELTSAEKALEERRLEGHRRELPTSDDA